MTSFESSAVWSRTIWRGETAWSSECGGIGAIVSEARSRLIHLGAPDGSCNLLNAPWPRVSPDENNPWPNHGGHRFWLGPQHRWGWPPPSEWEYAPAMEALVDGAVLSLHHARIDPAYPALAREYAWEGNRLRCTARWADDGRPYFGMHVVAVDAPFAITARLGPCAAFPSGLVAARMADPVVPLQLPHPAISMDEGLATVQAGIREVKLGFVPQSLTLERAGGWSLSVIPGPCGGIPGEMPDHGYLSQVWVGDGSANFAEIEQVTPLLQGDASGKCSSTIFIEASCRAEKADSRG
jgi:hypothetical protein